MKKDKKKHNVYLIGPMGSGKTTVGRQLAARIGVSFYDLDAEIEKTVGSDIPTIFAEHGESIFRQYESQQLQQCCHRANIVLSTGGGAVLAPENRACLSQTGIVLYLQVSAGEQLKRIIAQAAKRPLLKHDNTEARLAELTQERHPFYQAIADFSYSTDDQTPATVTEAILKDLSIDNGFRHAQNT